MHDVDVVINNVFSDKQISVLKICWKPNSENSKTLHHNYDGAIRVMLDKIISIDGVVSINFGKYQMTIVKGLVFDWDEIIYKTETMFKRTVGADEVHKVSKKFGDS